MFATFHDAIGYLFASYNQAQAFRQHKLDRLTRTPQYTRTLLDRLGAPDRQQHNIKVTGSKGKGSTSRMIAGILQAQGLTVGLFTSPHLVDFTERIRVNGRAISESDWLRLEDRLVPLIEELRMRMQPGEYFGPVGLAACVAALYFAEQQTDVNVFELGRGARFDDVNQIYGEVAVLTPVQLEHREQLGPELEDIAWNKAGIITPGLRAVVTTNQEPVVLARIHEEATRNGVKSLVLQNDFSLTEIHTSLTGTHFDVKTPYGEYENLQLSLLGSHQAENAAVAITAVEVWLEDALCEGLLREALARMAWPGRMQLLQRSPLVLVDGTINQEGAQYLREVSAFFPDRKKVLVIGVPADKDGLGVIRELGPEVAEIFITRAENPHLVFDAQKWLQEALAFAPTQIVEFLPAALAEAEAAAGPQGLVIVAGTQSLVADALKHYQVPTRDL